MRYLGSKNRISKHLKPIIESYLTDDGMSYIEPFVGGANMIDKIDWHDKTGSDSNKYLIALLNQAKKDVSVFPETVSFDEFQEVKQNKGDFEDWYVGLVGFCATFGSMFFGGYARRYRKLYKETGRVDEPVIEAIRSVTKQSGLLKNINFWHRDFTEYDGEHTPSVFYCDPPYAGAVGYGVKFDHILFYDWCREMTRKGHIVLVSEYNMPEGFECIWEKEIICDFNNHSKVKDKKRTEKLFICKGVK